MSKELGATALNLISEGVHLKKKIDDTPISGYRNPLWYDEAKERISEIETELGEILAPHHNGLS